MLWVSGVQRRRGADAVQSSERDWGGVAHPAEHRDISERDLWLCGKQLQGGALLDVPGSFCIKHKGGNVSKSTEHHDCEVGCGRRRHQGADEEGGEEVEVSNPGVEEEREVCWEEEVEVDLVYSIGEHGVGERVGRRVGGAVGGERKE